MAERHITLPCFSPKEIERFNSHVDRKGPDECWPWTAGRTSKRGYGGFKSRGIMFTASRVAYLLHFTTDPGKLLVCHHCDNPPCCNPKHFFLGTYSDNGMDASKKGRLKPLRGDNHPTRKYPERYPRGDRHPTRTNPECYQSCRGQTHYGAKLTEAQVREMREAYAEGYDTYKELGLRFGVHATTAWEIVTRQHWKHI